MERQNEHQTDLEQLASEFRFRLKVLRQRAIYSSSEEVFLSESVELFERVSVLRESWTGIGSALMRLQKFKIHHDPLWAQIAEHALTRLEEANDLKSFREATEGLQRIWLD